MKKSYNIRVDCTAWRHQESTCSVDFARFWSSSFCDLTIPRQLDDVVEENITSKVCGACQFTE